MTDRLRTGSNSQDPIEARAAELLRAIPSATISSERQARVAQRLLAREVRSRRWRLFGLGGLLLVTSGAVAATMMRAPIAQRTSTSEPRRETASHPAPAAPARRSTPRPPTPLLVPTESAPAAPPATPADVMWSTDFESGDAASWRTGGWGLGGVWAHAGAASADIVSDVVHRGRYAMRMTSQTSEGGPDRSARLYRRGFLPDDGYYSAWFYIPERYESPEYWMLFEFRAQLGEKDPDDGTLIAAFNVGNRADGEMAMWMYDGLNDRVMRQPNPIAVPVGTWFHLEVHLRMSPDGPGGFTVWQDGRPIFDVPAAPVPQKRWLYWALGSATRTIRPARAVVYIDDAAVTRTRVGTDAPDSLYVAP